MTPSRLLARPVARSAATTCVAAATGAGGDGRSPLARVPPLHTDADRAVAADPDINAMDEADLINAIDQLRRERDAVILAHNYQRPRHP